MIYLSEFHISWIADHSTVGLPIASKAEQLGIPYTEIFICLTPLRKNDGC